MKKNKGITLIALILTIVIMLILLAVGASYIINDNLIGRADNTVKAANNKINQQQTIVDDLMGELNKSTAAHDWQYTDETRVAIKCVCDDCKEAANSTEGRILYIGQQIMYTSTGTGSSSISEEKSGIAQAKTDGQSWATSYGVQTVNIASDDTKWVVLGAESSNGNDGTNETLLLTTQTPTTEKIKMYGYQPYNHAVDEINRMCKEIYGTDARGMRIEDVNECLNYKNPKGMYYINNKWNETQNLTTKLKDLGECWTAITNYNTNNKKGVFYDPSNPEGIKDNGAKLGEYNLDGYFYHLSNDGKYLVNNANASDTSHTITTVTRNLIFGETKQYAYWLASRGVLGDSDCADFGPGAVREGRAGSCFALFMSRGRDYSNGVDFPLRAVVSLTSKIPEAGEILVGQ